MEKKISYKIAIIGAGWYGCHIGMMLDSLGYDISLFEKENGIFQKASGYNQFRLHKGFHYVRNYRTRSQSLEGFSLFVDRYPSLIKNIKNNFYLIPKSESLIDFQTYKSVMMSSAIDFFEIERIPKYLKNIEGALNVEEKIILTEKSKNYYMKKIGHLIKLEHKVSKISTSKDYVLVNDQKYDFIIDATWGHLGNSKLRKIFEPTLLINYKLKKKGKHAALTLVDGPLCSLYPTERNDIFTLSSVPFTPLGKYKSKYLAYKKIKSFNSENLKTKKLLMEQQIKKYFPHFLDIFEFESPQLSMKTKLTGQSDDRSCYIEINNRIISIFSGKIDTIFYASNRIISFLENSQSLKHKKNFLLI